MIITCKKLLSLGAIIFVTGCVGGGGMSSNTGYGANNSMAGGMEAAILSAIIQGMAGSVLNGQIGSQLAPTEQDFRLQQLGRMVQSGKVNQSQQWVVPQTGNRISIQPIGQQIINPKNRQQCRNLEEILVFKNGRTIREKRLACLNPQTKRWDLVQ